ncbi:MAG: hypothetical protein AAB449_00425 [Patescibacteria group bacterium]
MKQLRNIVFIGALLITPLISSAQLVSEPVQYLVAPETPGPNEQVVIKIEGVGTFLGDSTITWRENGSIKLTGVGERTYRFVTGALGSQTSITVSINSASQGLIERSLLFRPSVVNLIWEADTTAPLFYRGKPLYSAGAELKVVAFPTVIINKSLVAPQSLSFQWSRGDEPAPDQSGLGRNTFSFTGDQLQNAETVSVDVYFGTARVGHGRITIPAQDPLILLYSRDPLRGEIVDTAFPGAISLLAKEITIQAEPYFFSRNSGAAGLLGYTWTLNNEEIVGPESARGLLTLRQTGEGGGGATLQVNVQNNDPDKLVQAAQAGVEIIFGASASSALSSFFGL